MTTRFGLGGGGTAATTASRRRPIDDGMAVQVTTTGVGNASALAGGISEALLTTAAGLCVAIPALIFHRYFERRIAELVIGMEQEALKMVEVFHGEREVITK